MNFGQQLGFSPARKVYHPSPKRYLKLQVIFLAFSTVVWGLFLLFFLLQTIENPGYFIGFVFIGPFEAFLVSYFLWRTHLRLVTSVEGIGYSTGGYRIFTPWDNVAGFGRRQEIFSTPQGMSWTVEISGLELQQPAPVYKANPMVRLFLRLHGIERPSFFIPISNVVENWQDSEVAADIQRFAPGVAMKMPLFTGSISANT
jgi:hypothetical protein